MIEMEHVKEGFMRRGSSRGRARSPNLIGMVVRVIRINLEPFKNAVGAVLGMCSDFSEIGLRHAIEQIPRAASRCLKRQQRAGDRTVVMESSRELLFVVCAYLRVFFRNEQPEPDR